MYGASAVGFGILKFTYLNYWFIFTYNKRGSYWNYLALVSLLIIFGGLVYLFSMLGAMLYSHTVICLTNSGTIENLS